MRNKPIKNEVMTDEAVLKKLQKEKERYRNEMDKLKTQLEQVHIIIRVVLNASCISPRNSSTSRPQ